MEVQGRALLAPQGQAGMNLSQVAQHLLAVCCRICCHHLVLTSNLHQHDDNWHGNMAAALCFLADRTQMVN